MRPAILIPVVVLALGLGFALGRLGRADGETERLRSRTPAESATSALTSSNLPERAPDGPRAPRSDPHTERF